MLEEPSERGTDQLIVTCPLVEENQTRLSGALGAVAPVTVHTESISSSWK